jgi:hypothetical protein
MGCADVIRRAYDIFEARIAHNPAVPGKSRSTIYYNIISVLTSKQYDACEDRGC